MIRKFARITICKDKTKGICALIAMLLTSILFSTLFTTVIGINKAAEYSRIKTSGTISQIVLKDCDSKTMKVFSKIKNNDLVKSAGYRKCLADVTSGQLSYNVELSYEDSAYSNHCFQKLAAGHMPQDTYEIVMDDGTMKSLKIEKKLGETVTLELRVGKRQIEQEFYLSGWFPTNHATERRTGKVITSKKYIKEWESLFEKDTIYGQDNIDILLKHSNNIEEQAVKIIKQEGLDSKNVDYSLNPGYMNSGTTMDMKNVVAIILAIALIILVGYLIINNIFYIAAMKDAKQYGQLKTLGMARKQIGKFVRCQAGYLLMIAIPIGVLLGVFIGIGILPAILKQTNLVKQTSGMFIGAQEIICILILSVGFIIFTTMISIYGPIRKIGKLSAVESTKLELKMYGGKRKTSDGGKLHKFAFYNITRNKKNTFKLIISITLPILLVSISFSILDSFDMNKYLRQMIYSDYQVATTDYFKSEYQMDNGETAAMSKEVIDKIKSSNVVKKSGTIYASCNDERISIAEEEESRDEYWLNFYGIDKFNLRSNMLVEKDADLETLFQGDGILEGVWLNDDGSMMQGNSDYNIGDTVTIKVKGGNKREFHIVGHVILGESLMDTKNYGIDNTHELYVCSEAYKKLIHDPQIMAYTFDVKKGCESKAENLMKDNIASYPGINFHTKDTFIDKFMSLKNTVKIICTMLCVILTLIALFNLVNVFVTSIIVRKGEFATMRSIGMSNKQLRRMLLYEMLYYCSPACILSMIFSVLLSKSMLERVSQGISYLTYSQNMFVFLYITVVVILICVFTALVCERNMNMKNIADRIRQQ